MKHIRRQWHISKRCNNLNLVIFYNGELHRKYLKMSKGFPDKRDLQINIRDLIFSCDFRFVLDEK